MEAAYEKIIGPINPSDPSQSFLLNIWVLKKLGMWTFKTKNRLIQKLYSVYSISYRIFFLYGYIATQVYFLVKVENLLHVAEGIISLLTHIALSYKLEKFYQNRDRIKNVVEKLGGSIFRPSNSEESQCIKLAMKQCFGFSFWFFSILQPTVVVWILEPFFQGVRKLPVAARFPYSTDNNFVFALTFAYQIIGLYFNAAVNIASDGIGSGLMAHLNGQVKRLGVQLEKIGNETPKTYGDENDEQIVEISSRATHSDLYNEWIRCIMFHKSILSLKEEIEDIFKKPIFVQFVCTCIILCMNCFLIVTTAQETATMMKNLSYLSGVLTQIVLFCWIGSELTFSSQQLSTQAFSSNTPMNDQTIKKVMLIFMERTNKEISVEAGSLFRIDMNLPTFLTIVNLSYSFFNVMRTMESK